MSYRFCPLCGATLGMRVVKPGESERPACTACDFVWFVDPKIAAGCIVETPDGIVLVRRGIEPAYGKWVFPGGYVDHGERVEDAARRETREESCLEVRITLAPNVYSYSGRPVIVVVFTGGSRRRRVGGGGRNARSRDLRARRNSLARARLQQHVRCAARIRADPARPRPARGREPAGTGAVAAISSESAAEGQRGLQAGPRGGDGSEAAARWLGRRSRRRRAAWTSARRPRPAAGAEATCASGSTSSRSRRSNARCGSRTSTPRRPRGSPLRATMRWNCVGRPCRSRTCSASAPSTFQPPPG